MALTCGYTTFSQVSGWLTNQHPEALRSASTDVRAEFGGPPITVNDWAATSAGHRLVRVPGPAGAGLREEGLPVSARVTHPGRTR